MFLVVRYASEYVYHVSWHFEACLRCDAGSVALDIFIVYPVVCLLEKFSWCTEMFIHFTCANHIVTFKITLHLS